MNNVKSIIQPHNNFILTKHKNNITDHNVKKYNIYKNINKSFNYKLKPTSRTCNKADCTVSNCNINNNKCVVK